MNQWEIQENYCILCGELKEDTRSWNAKPASFITKFGTITNYWKHDGPAHASSILYDTAAVHLAYSGEFTRLERLKLAVDDGGFTRISPEGREMLVATEMTDPAAFRQRLIERLTTTEPIERIKNEKVCTVYPY